MNSWCRWRCMLLPMTVARHRTAGVDLGLARIIGCPPHMLLRCTAIGNDRFKPAAIRSGDVDDYSCSHDESLNCFARFGNRLNESDH